MDQTGVSQMARDGFAHMTRNDFKNMTRNDFKNMRRRKLPDINAFERKIYEAMSGLLIKQTQDICKKSGLSFEEMKQQADYIFCYALRRFNDERGVKFSTFLWSAVHNGLIDYGRAQRKQDGTEHMERIFFEDDDGNDAFDTMLGTNERGYAAFVNFCSMTADMLELAELAITEGVANLRELYHICKEKLAWDDDRFQETCEDLRAEVAGWAW